MSEIGLVDGDSIIDAVGLNVSDSDVTGMSCMEVREHKDFRGKKCTCASTTTIRRRAINCPTPGLEVYLVRSEQSYCLSFEDQTYTMSHIRLHLWIKSMELKCKLEMSHISMWRGTYSNVSNLDVVHYIGLSRFY